MGRHVTILINPRWWQIIERFRRWRWLRDDSDVVYGDFAIQRRDSKSEEGEGDG